MLVWHSPSGTLIRLPQSGNAQPIEQLVSPLEASFRPGGHIEVVDEALSRLLTFGPDGSLRDSRRVHVAGRISSAYAIEDGWLLTTRPDSAHANVYRMDRAMRAVLLCVLPTQSRILVSYQDGTILVTERRPPFRIGLINANAGTCPSHLKERPLPQDDGAWTANRLVPIGRSRSVQTLADLRSIRRLFYIFHRERLHRRTLLSGVPMAIVASDVHAREMLAVRRSDALEIIRYRYEWAALTKPRRNNHED